MKTRRKTASAKALVFSPLFRQRRAISQSSHAFVLRITACLGGKTGTANKINPVTKGYDDDRQVVSFLGYIAGGDGPRLGGIVIIDEPRLAEHLNYGGRLAAPLFRRIAEKAMAYYDVPALFAFNERAAKPGVGKNR